MRRLTQPGGCCAIRSGLVALSHLEESRGTIEKAAVWSIPLARHRHQQRMSALEKRECPERVAC